MQTQTDQPPTTTMGEQSSSTQPSTSSPVQLLSHSDLLRMVEWYYTPTLVCLGTFGNCLAMYVLLRTTHLRKLSSSHYLAALAASDTVQLQLIFLVWLIVLGADLLNRKVLCEIMQFLMAVTSFLSVWFVLAFTAERFVAVKYPFRSKYLCTVSKARAIIGMLTSVALLIYSPILLFADAEERVGQVPNTTTEDEVGERNETVLMEAPFETFTTCTVSSKWTTAYMYFNMVDTAIACQVPVVAILILNIFICKHVFWFSRIHKRLINNGGSSEDIGSRNVNNGGTCKQNISGHVMPLTIGGEGVFGARAKKSSYKLTKMLLIVSTVCLMLNLPSYVMRVLMSQLNVEGDAQFAELQHWATAICNINFGINFLVYCVSGQNFRKAARAALCPHRNNNRREHSESRTHSTGSSAKKRINPLQNTVATSVIM